MKIRKINLFELWPENVYKSTIFKIEKFIDGEESWLRWTFKVEGKSFASGLTPAILFDGNRLDRWLRILDVNIKVGQEVETADLLGKAAIINITVDDTGQYANADIVDGR